MDQPIYKYMPLWVQQVVDSDMCQKCNNHLNKNNIIACGLREKKNGQVFYVEVKCPSCTIRTVIPFEHSEVKDLRSMCFMLLDKVKKQNQAYSSKENKKVSQAVITNEEVDIFLKMLHETKNHDDFMRNIGAETPPSAKKPKKDSNK